MLDIFNSLAEIQEEYQLDTETFNDIVEIFHNSESVEDFIEGINEEYEVEEGSDESYWDDLFADLTEYFTNEMTDSNEPIETFEEPREDEMSLSESIDDPFEEILQEYNLDAEMLTLIINIFKSSETKDDFDQMIADEFRISDDVDTINYWNDLYVDLKHHFGSEDDIERFDEMDNLIDEGRGNYVRNGRYPSPDEFGKEKGLPSQEDEFEDDGYTEFKLDEEVDEYEPTDEENYTESIPSKVIVIHPTSTLKMNQVLEVVGSTKTHYLYKKGKTEMGVEKQNVQPLLSESNIRKGISLSEKRIALQYIKYQNKGVKHNRICEALAESYRTTPEDVEFQLNEVFDDNSNDFFFNNATKRSNQPLSFTRANQMRYQDDVGIVIDDTEDEFNRGYLKYGYDGHKLNEDESFDLEEEQIADDVFMQLIKNSKYKEGYDTLEDAVLAVISVMNLEEQLGEDGALRVIDIIKQKFVNNKDDEDYELDSIETISPVESTTEAEVGKEITEAVKRNFGVPRSWEKTNTHFVARFYDKPIVESKIKEIRRLTLSFDKAKEDDEYTLLYFRR